MKKLFSITMWMIGLTIVMSAPMAEAGSFDFIYPRDMNVFFFSNQTGMVTIYHSFGLLVNPGENDITSKDLATLEFKTTSSVEGIVLGIDPSYVGDFSPIAPHEAIGSIFGWVPSIPAGNGVLLNMLQPEETFRNTAPSSFLGSPDKPPVLVFYIYLNTNQPSAYSGDVYFDTTMKMSGEIVTFQTHVYFDNTLNPDPPIIEFLSASRVSSVGVPDLVVKSLHNPPASKKRGQIFKVKDVIVNQGTADAGQFTVGYYLSEDNVKSEDDIYIEGNRSISDLGVGERSNKTVKVRIPSDTPPGRYYLIVCADDMDEVLESDETNNCKASKKRIKVLD